MKPEYYILKGKEIIEEPDLLKWAQWFETQERFLFSNEIGGGEIRVSTVFLGLDHNWFGEGEPILFETMIFGGKFDNEQWRYRTYDEAEEGHKKVVAKALMVFQ
jgi:hypothetical protein